MAIIIEGARAPKSCMECNGTGYFLKTVFGAECPLCTRKITEGSAGAHLLAIERLPGCPIKELPENHGPLIDVDPVISTIDKFNKALAYGAGVRNCLDVIKAAPHILEAEEGHK